VEAFISRMLRPAAPTTDASKPPVDNPAGKSAAEQPRQ
jgi:hypothetical protein